MLRVVAAEVIVGTEHGRFSGRARFDEGLGIIRAENNMGKTTILMSILYAMGLEGMLGPGDQQPLKPAVLREIRDEEGNTHAVIESWVMLELGNRQGDRLTLQRPIVSNSDKSTLVHTWSGPALTDPNGVYTPRDFYVRMGGAAQREAGLHHHLAGFIGWDLPRVTTWRGESVPLYMEILFSLLFVEQTRGWAGIAAVMPKYLQVRDPDRRAIEFLTGMEALTRARDHDELLAELSDLKADWRASAEGFRVRVTELGGLVDGLPMDPPAMWPPPVPIGVRILHNEEWIGLGEALSHLRAELRTLSDEVPRVEDVADKTMQQLRDAETRVGRLTGLVGATARDVREQKGELDALRHRLEALEEDRERYADAIRLADLGSVQHLAVESTRCPTCDQHLPHILLGDQLRPVMTLEDNKALLDEERKTFTAMRNDAESVATASKQRLLGLRRELDAARSDVRLFKTTLLQQTQAPARAVIEQQVRLAQRVEQLEPLQSGIASIDEQLSPLAARHLQLRAALGRMRGGGLSSSDLERLDALEVSIREQLGEYGFSSVPPSEIRIARDSYLPQRGDRPIAGKDISASDNVRLVWAYLVGLLEVARRFDTSHLGFLAFDEPGQQEISDESLQAFFARLDVARDVGQQVLVATSKPSSELATLLDGRPASVNDFVGHTLQRLND
jgi:hypothetical protein